MANIVRTGMPVHTLILCSDIAFVGTMRGVLRELNAVPKNVRTCDEAMDLVRSEAFDVVLVDWREIDNLGEFLGGLHRSEQNADCVLIAIVRDLLDLRQAFAAGVHFLIHKPASAVQIERCLRAAYCATVARRRKQHREPVQILASVVSRTQPFGEAMVTNLSEGGLGLKTSTQSFVAGVSVSAGEEVDLRFQLPDVDAMLQVTGIVVWTTATHCGIRFRYLPEDGRAALDQWLTQCVERSLAEVCERVRDACA